ncbi:DUF371 domain-containing protein [Candidatus Woesearchaeota archaeon]|nr:DUF371 domain-containing protein [Candidatus Woesearchaeota archaeon]
MGYTFTAHGHPNILATHKTTLEITKDSELTKSGDCIVAVNANFSLQRIKELISNCNRGDKIKLIIEAAGLEEEITAIVNKDFLSEKEIVLRKGSFASERTFGINCNKAAADISRELVEKLKNEKTAVSVTIETL